MSLAPVMIEAAIAASVDNMIVSNALVFTQTDSDGYFIMDPSLTFANPDPPRTGTTVNFNLGGVWTQPVEIDHMNFKCKLFGVLAYNEDFPDQEVAFPGEWTYSLPFDVPPVAPTATYYVTVSAWDVNGQELFSIDTNFKL